MTAPFRNSFINLLGITSITILGILSIIYYQERICFSDPAFQLFLLINDNQIEVMTNRWPSTIFRWLPFLGMKMGSSIATLSKLFSLSFPLFHLIAFGIISMIYKDRVMGLLLILSLLVATSETFYWCSSDLLQGMVTFFMGITIFNKSHSLVPKYVLGGFLMVAAVFFHPLCLFPFFFIVIDDLLERKKIRTSDCYLPLVFGISWIVRNQFFSTWYDVAKGKDFWNNFDNLNWFNIPAHKSFFAEIPIHYQLLFLLLVVSVIILIKRKAFFRLAFMLLTIPSYLLLIHLGNPSEVASFYREASYIPLVVFVSYPFVKYILAKESIALKYKIFIPIVIIFSLMRILFFAPEYTERITWMENKLDTMSCTKEIIPLEASEESLLKMSWGLPFETTLLSAETNQLKTLFNTSNEKDFLKKERRDIFLSPFKLLYTSDFNKSYLPFEEGHYCKYSRKEE